MSMKLFKCGFVIPQALWKNIPHAKSNGDGPLETYGGGGGAGQSSKKIFVRGKISRKKVKAYREALKIVPALTPKKFLRGKCYREKVRPLENSTLPPPPNP